VGNRVGWVLYLSLLLVFVAGGYFRHLRRRPRPGPEERAEEQKGLLVFVIGWILVILMLAAGWVALHGFPR
jgi:hypothetical protein